MITKSNDTTSPTKKRVCSDRLLTKNTELKDADDKTADSSFEIFDDSWLEKNLEALEQTESLSSLTTSCETSSNDVGYSTASSKEPSEGNRSLKSWIKDILKQNVDILKESTQLEEKDDGPFFGLPEKVIELLESNRGITELYDWQKECLNLPVVREGKNLIYCLPTSGGKTLVAEILIFRELLCKFRNVLFILPYVSIVQEKVRALSPFAVDLNFVVEEYAGSNGCFPPRKRTKRHTVYLATIEKAHSLVNSLVEEGRIEELGLVVVDELHMLYEEGSRGAILEIALTKLMFTTRQIQIIGMSATLKHMDKLKAFLDASDYSGNFRPVDLEEFIKLQNKIYQVKRQGRNYEINFVRDLKFQYTSTMKQRDPDCLLGLVLEVVPLQSCLIFCPTKKHCENVALLLGKLMPSLSTKYKEEEKAVLMDSLSRENSGQICPVLAKSIRCGVAYHHSGLTTDERRLIEEAYLDGVLCCLACTSTLAAGVNLPAKRVIVRAPYVGATLLTATRYKQMIGRAGRAGLSQSGESILILKENEASLLNRVLVPADEPFQSALEDPPNMHIFLLSLVGLQLADDEESFFRLIRCSLFAADKDAEEVKKVVRDAFDSLKETAMLFFQGKKPCTTSLGRAVYKSGLTPEFGNRLFHDLQKSLQMVSLNTHLHLLYLITPYNFDGVKIIPDVYFRTFLSLKEDDVHVATLIGITESVVTRLVAGRLTKQSDPNVLPRFYLTLVLYDLWNQKSIWHVAEKYDLHRGTVHSLLTSAIAFGSSILHFCQELPEFWALKELMPSFVKQMSYCVSSELIPLMELPAVKRGRARQLYNAGFKTLTDVARAKPKEMVTKVEHLPYRVASQMVAAAKMLLLQRVEALQEEAQEMATAIQE